MQVQLCSEAGLRERADVSHIWYFAAPPHGGAGARSAHGVRDFQQITTTATAAGGAVQQIQYTSYQSGESESSD